MPLYADALPPTIRARPDRAEYKWWHLADYVTCIRPESARKTAGNPGENKGLQWSIKLEARVAEIHGNWRRDVRKERSINQKRGDTVGEFVRGVGGRGFWPPGCPSLSRFSLTGRREEFANSIRRLSAGVGERPIPKATSSFGTTVR